MDPRQKTILYFILGFAPLPVLCILPEFLPAGGPVKWITLTLGVLIVANFLPFTWAALILIFLLLRFHWLKRRPLLTEYGIAPPLCQQCGYDLRASPDVCPECGTKVRGLDGTIIRYLMSLRRRDSIDHSDSSGGSPLTIHEPRSAKHLGH